MIEREFQQSQESSGQKSPQKKVGAIFKFKPSFLDRLDQERATGEGMPDYPPTHAYAKKEK